MPKGPQGQKRPADVVGNAITVAKIATGEIEKESEDQDDGAGAVRAQGRRAGRAAAEGVRRHRLGGGAAPGKARRAGAEAIGGRAGAEGVIVARSESCNYLPTYPEAHGPDLKRRGKALSVRHHGDRIWKSA